MSAELRLAVAQLAPRLGSPAANGAAIAAAVADADADLVLTAELGLTGYDLGDDAARLATSLSSVSRTLAEAGAAGDVVLGLPELDRDGRVYNSAVHLRGGAPLHVHRKVYLPTYGMFDEARFFARGDGVRAYEPAAGWRAGLLVCEDLWHPALPYLLAADGIDLLLVLAAAPGRGVGEGGPGAARFASADVWERIARTTAQLYGVYVALANRTGVEGAVTFAGGSLIVAPDGAVLARAADDREETIAAELSLAEVRRARTPYAHLRDDDPRLTLRELARRFGP